MVEVAWSDYTAVPNWNEDLEVDSYQFVSVGWLMEDTATRIVIAMSYGFTEDKWREFMVFPKAAPEIRVIAEGAVEVAKKKPPRKVGGKG